MDGNIASIRWVYNNKTQDSHFKYDSLSRLIAVDYDEDNTLSEDQGRYSEQFWYDQMGNTIALKRNGKISMDYYGCVDDLLLIYDGNQLRRVMDNGQDGIYAGAFDFEDSADEEVEYEYDKNGNMTKDLNKNISSIAYNCLNLPEKVTMSHPGLNSSVRFVYDGVGRKLSAYYAESRFKSINPLERVMDEVVQLEDVSSKPLSLSTPSTSTKSSLSTDIGTKNHIESPKLLLYNESRTDYCGNVIYEDGVCKLLISEGYVMFNKNTGKIEPHYYLKDHLGNVRVVLNRNGITRQANHYYAFGGLTGDSYGGDVQRYKYNGKELDRFLGWDMMDYGARWYDSKTQSWSTIDPLAEKYYSISPYVYCSNNPINRIDPNGMDWYSSLDSIDCVNGQIVWQTQIHYTDCISQEQLSEKKINGTYLGKTVVLFDGYYDEKLGNDNTLNGSGSKYATATVYGAKGLDDITRYTAFTMTSDFDKYGAIQDGVYNGSWRSNKGSGLIPKHYMLENGGAINTIDGNRYEKGYSKDQKNGIFIHRTNNDGTASGRVSVGCLLIDAKQMDSFEKQVGNNSFKVILRRK